ncbi:AMP-binding protein [Pararhodobacter sp.]|uniref:AMP-binding protein n=1 Tax=Pararhodobacter sp. TaxID=2127056 RepID=UPI002AFEED77|nr:AMP-binding protein [Pararhodobacter sp.]
MAHISQIAAQSGDSVAFIDDATGQRIRFGALEALINQTARFLIAQGVRPGGNIAFCLPNDLSHVVLILAAQRTGAYYTMIPSKSSLRDVAFFVEDCGAPLLITGAGMFDAQPLANALPAQTRVLMLDGPELAYGDSLAALVAPHPPHPHPEFRTGTQMSYSSGSTGKPKGIRTPLPDRPWNAPDPRNERAAADSGLDGTAVFLNTSPIYHSAPHRFVCAALSAGATVVSMRHFDALAALKAIEKYRCTHGLWVPTMFHRLLSLPKEQRERYDLSSIRSAIHGAAPCPIATKEAMIAWWGPVLDEYYSGTEGIGNAIISSKEWLQHKGSVGRPLHCTAHILDDNDNELPTGEVGGIYFDSPASFSYWNAAEKTKASISRQGWKTFGDLGYVDADGYLYLTGRRSFTIISGGVNLYPQEIEAALIACPDVVDAVVIGLPDPDFGERAVALINLRDGLQPTTRTLAAIKQRLRDELGSIKTPKAFHFIRTPLHNDSGKVQRPKLIEAFLKGAVAEWPVLETESGAIDNGQ